MDRNGEHQVTQLHADGKGSRSSKAVAKGNIRKPIAMVRPISAPDGDAPYSREIDWSVRSETT